MLTLMNIKRVFSVAAVCLALSSVCADDAAVVRSEWLMRQQPMTAQRGDLPRSTPEQQGVSSDIISAFYDTLLNVKQIDIHGVVIMRHGKVISELYPKPYREDSRLTLYSVSKTFTGLAVGIAVDKGLIDINKPITEYLSQEPRAKNQEPRDAGEPPALPENSPTGPVPTVRDLLTMRSGIEPDWTLRDTCNNWTQRLLEKPRDSVGLRYGYDSMMSYLLAEAVQNVTGMTLLDFLDQNLFRPLDINDASWEVSPESVNTGGWGLMLSNCSMAKVGQLLLQLGAWGGQQIVSRRWMAEMMAAHSNNGKSDYGYQIWVNPDGMSYRADGALGQYILVHPKQDMVCVITSCTNKSPVSAASLWWQFVTAKKLNDTALADDTLAHDHLLDRQNFAALPTCGGMAKSPMMKSKVEKELKINATDSTSEWHIVSVTQAGRALRLRIVTKSGHRTHIDCGFGYWRDNRSGLTPPYYIKAQNRLTNLKPQEGRVSGCYGFTSPYDLHVQLQFTNFGTRYDTHIKLKRK